jgi:hypothetical protein
MILLLQVVILKKRIGKDLSRSFNEAVGVNGKQIVINKKTEAMKNILTLLEVAFIAANLMIKRNPKEQLFTSIGSVL